MSVKLLLFVALLLPVTLAAAATNQEAGRSGSNAVQDPEMFEFLAMFDQNDAIYIETEMDDIKRKTQADAKNPKVMKSESNEK